MKDTPDQVGMTEAEIIEARDWIVNKRTRRDSPKSDVNLYNSRTKIDQIVADLRLARALAE